MDRFPFLSKDPRAQFPMPVEIFPTLPESSTSRPHAAGPAFPVRHLPVIHKLELDPAWPPHQQPSALFSHRIFLLRSPVAAARRDALPPWSRLGNASWSRGISGVTSA